MSHEAKHLGDMSFRGGYSGYYNTWMQQRSRAGAKSAGIPHVAAAHMQIPSQPGRDVKQDVRGTTFQSTPVDIMSGVVYENTTNVPTPAAVENNNLEVVHTQTNHAIQQSNANRN
jgi:hypothetical protein